MSGAVGSCQLALTVPVPGAATLDLTPMFRATIVVADGASIASFTVGIDHLHSIETQIRVLATARRYFLARPERCVLVRTAADIVQAKQDRKLAVNFHLQGTNALLGDLHLVEVYRALGVGHMLMAYNEKNLVGDGCHERTDAGLSHFRVRLVREMNRVGILVDLSHTRYRTSMDVLEASAAPVIFWMRKAS